MMLELVHLLLLYVDLSTMSMEKAVNNRTSHLTHLASLSQYTW